MLHRERLCHRFTELSVFGFPTMSLLTFKGLCLLIMVFPPGTLNHRVCSVIIRTTDRASFKPIAPNAVLKRGKPDGKKQNRTYKQIPLSHYSSPVSGIQRHTASLVTFIFWGAAASIQDTDLANNWRFKCANKACWHLLGVKKTA